MTLDTRLWGWNVYSRRWVKLGLYPETLAWWAKIVLQSSGLTAFALERLPKDEWA